MSMKGRLNIFQRAMVLWNDLHPYNAVHVAAVPETLDMERLQDILGGTLESLGLTGLMLDRQSATYDYRGGPAAEKIETVEAGDDASATLSAEIHKQLNSPFASDGNISPFRFFVIDAGSQFYLGIAYLHVVAGAESVVLLMQDWISSYLERQDRGFKQPVNLYPSTYGPWLRRHPLVILRKIMNLPILFWNLEHSWRPRYRGEMNTDNGFSSFSLNAEQLGHLKAASKRWGVTVNDLFLSCLFKIFAPLQDHRAYSRRRNRFSIGTIVNIRKDMGIDSKRTFGVFLGSFVVSHAAPEGISLKQIALDVRRQTARIKRSRRYLGTPVDLASSIRTLSILSTERKKKFYQKHYPLWGGVTNMNLNTIWPQSPGQEPIDYFRAVSTGPATPLVLSVTTVLEKVNISISYRTTVYTKSDIDFIKSEFSNLFQQLEDDL